MEYVRVSAAYLFDIKINNLYFLVKSERRNQYQPVGGCYKYFPQAQSFFNSIGVIPEKKSNGIDSLMDIRLLVPKQNLQLFIDWYKTKVDRETTFDREFNEEVVQPFVEKKHQHIFKNINTIKKINGSFNLYYDEEKNILTIKPMDIITIEFTDNQKKYFNQLCSTQSTSFILATKQDILSGHKILLDGSDVKIGSHTKKILENQNELEA